MEEQANVYRIRFSVNSSWFFNRWNGIYPSWCCPFHYSEAPVFTLDEAEQIAMRLSGSVVELVEHSPFERAFAKMFQPVNFPQIRKE